MKTSVKRDILKEKVVDLVKEFVKTEGSIDFCDLFCLFGDPFRQDQTVAAALAELPIFFE
ncbi:MAG: hypothetical protein A2Z73_06220 [Deltaproteobacteria bacterium RBG_13_60_28]|nr:MAG: hypothetical protein A2Z73_06220 [Deltaproteobacteria bacterium RBG_13_60_28]